jgi:hypothetical protein
MEAKHYPVIDLDFVKPNLTVLVVVDADLYTAEVAPNPTHPRTIYVSPHGASSKLFLLGIFIPSA